MRTILYIFIIVIFAQYHSSKCIHSLTGQKSKHRKLNEQKAKALCLLTLSESCVNAPWADKQVDRPFPRFGDFTCEFSNRGGSSCEQKGCVESNKNEG